MKKIQFIIVFILLFNIQNTSIGFESIKINSNINSIIYVDINNTKGPWYGTQEFPYKNINDGLNHSINGDTIFVYEGIYKEKIIINKSIFLKGENYNSTIINGVYKEKIIEIISDNIINWNSDMGICVFSPFHSNIITNNLISHNTIGCWLSPNSTFNIVIENTFFDNTYGIHDYNSYNNDIYHNNLIDNNINANSYLPNNTWDDGYPSGGNYWDDYTGIDSNNDGIGETPYPIPGGNSRDNYPLVHPFGLISELPTHWCFISLPTNLSTNVSDVLVLHNDTFYSYQEAIDEGIISPFFFFWNRVSQSYEFVDVLHPGYAYWIYAYKNCGLWTLCYERNFDDFISYLEPKWNSVGIEFDYEINKYDILVNGVPWSEAVSDGIISDYVFGWNRNTQSYIFKDLFEPGNAYWVYSYIPCTLKRST